MDKIWTLPSERLLTQFKTDLNHGLASSEARARLRRYGANQLTVSDRPSALLLLLRQIQNPLTYILIIASLVSLFQDDIASATVILVVVVFNVAVGFLQEHKAEETIQSLRSVLTLQARVIRDGIEQKVKAALLVPGDILAIEAGDRVPADARIINAANLRVNESALTGEAVPAHKKANVIRGEVALADRQNMLFMSTLIVDGRALAVVTHTGMQTEIGAISREVAHVKPLPTLLQRKMAILGRYLLVVALLLTAILFFFGLARDIPLLEMLTTALSLLVSIVPEGLPVAVTVVLSVGLMRIYRRKALVRQLAAAETLGSATVICVDKTGTLTEGEMMVEKLLLASEKVSVSGHGYSLSGDFSIDGKKIDLKKHPAVKSILEMASLATMSTISKKDLKDDEAKILTDPTETALAVVGAKAGYYAFSEERTHPEVLEIPFDQDKRFSASVHKFERTNRYIVKGSPEKILQLSSHILTANGSVKRLLPSTRTDLERQAEEMAATGYRLVALAYANRPAGEEVGVKNIKQLTLCGLFCLTDPIRSDVKRAIAQAHESGVRVIMITGDHLLTAKSIAAKIGLDQHGSAVHAADLRTTDISTISVIARATPTEKLWIIDKLQKRGEIVAMTGDGVNDAPALKKADIGIAMGKNGTDVAIEASAMVLTNDNFSAIVAAIEQGRLIWENLRKVIFYLVSTTLAEVLIVVAALFMGLPLPLIAVQILWMNLVTDGVMSVALTLEPEEDDLMKKPPRPPSTSLVDGGMIRRMLFLSLVMTAGTLFIYLAFLPRGIDYARTAALTIMVAFQLLNVFNARSATRSAFSIGIGRNPIIFALLAVALVLQVASVYVPFFQHFLRTVPLDSSTILIIISVSASIILADELRKIARSVMLNWAKLQQATD